MPSRSVGSADQQLMGLVSGVLGLHNLAPALFDFYVVGYFFDGQASLALPLAEANAAADRYYRWAFDPPAVGELSRLVPLADLCRLRGEPERARRIEASLTARMGSRVESMAGGR